LTQFQVGRVYVRKIYPLFWVWVGLTIQMSRPDPIAALGSRSTLNGYQYDKHIIRSNTWKCHQTK